MNRFTLSANGIAFLQAREGLRLFAYNNGDKWTIGYGNTYYEDGSPVKRGDVITQARATTLFKYVLKEYESDVNKLVTSKINQTQFDALVSYSYNRGSYKFASTKLIDMVIANPNDQNIRKQFEIEWGTSATFKDALIARRKLEADLYFGGAGSAQSANSTWVFVLLGLGYLASKR